MHITIERANLVKPLDMLGRIVERRNTIPILSNLLLRAAGGKLSISATDLDMAATATVAAEIHAPGAVTVPALTLKEIVRKLPDGCQADLRLSDDGAQMTIRAGRSRFVLHALPEQDWPDMTGPDGGAAFEVMGVEIDNMLQGVDFAISTEETRYYLNGVYLHPAPDAAATALRGVATDGHRLAMRDVTAAATAADIPGVIVPRKAVAELRKLAADRPASVMQMVVSAAKMTVTCGDISLTTKLIDGAYPDYRRVVPQHNPHKATLFRAALLQAVERVATVAEGKSRAIKFAFGDAGLTLSVTSPDTGQAEEAVDCDYSGEPVEIGFNGGYVLGLLAVVDADRIEISLADGGSPALWRGLSTEAEGHTLVLMPMRV